MNDFSELENQLKKLRPIAPSENLTARIEQALAKTGTANGAGILSQPRRINWSWLSLGLGLAAATVVLIFARLNFDQSKPPQKIASAAPSSVAPAQAAEFIPADFTRVVYRTRDEGLRFSSRSAQPLRRIRSEGSETFQWRNPKTGASLRVSYPSEEISLTPISGQ